MVNIKNIAVVCSSSEEKHHASEIFETLTNFESWVDPSNVDSYGGMVFISTRNEKPLISGCSGLCSELTNNLVKIPYKDFILILDKYKEEKDLTLVANLLKI